MSATLLPAPFKRRLETELQRHSAQGWERRLQARASGESMLDLSNNDYLRLASDPRLVEAAQEALRQWGTSASASPLLTGYTRAHEEAEAVFCQWHGFPVGLIWNSGYAANQGILSCLPKKGDLILADRLIHHSMIAGILKSGAQFKRYRHCDGEHLEDLLRAEGRRNRVIFVVTESVFSMEGDYPDLKAMAQLKDKYGFIWVVDEAHALGWYGQKGSGLVEAHGIASQVDILVGTLGKALASMGAYTLFHKTLFKRTLINFAGEFVYSTYLPPAAVAVATRAVSLIEAMKAERKHWQTMAKAFRHHLKAHQFVTVGEDSPIVPIILGETEKATALAHALALGGIRVAAVRPPTVPEGSSRLRVSWHRKLDRHDLQRIVEAIREAASSRVQA